MIRKLLYSIRKYEVSSTHQCSIIQEVEISKTIITTRVALWELKLMRGQGSTSRLQRGKVEVTLYISVQVGIIDRSCVRWIPQGVYIQLRFGQKIFDPSPRCTEISASDGISCKSETWRSGYSESLAPGHESRSCWDASQSRPLSWLLLNLVKKFSSSIWEKERPKPWYSRRTSSNCMTSTVFR